MHIASFALFHMHDESAGKNSCPGKHSSILPLTAPEQDLPSCSICQLAQLRVQAKAAGVPATSIYTSTPGADPILSITTASYVNDTVAAAARSAVSSVYCATAQTLQQAQGKDHA